MQNFIAHWRHQKGFTQPALIALIRERGNVKFSVTTLKEYEHGRVKKMKPRVLREIAEIFGITVDQLFDPMETTPQLQPLPVNEQPEVKIDRMVQQVHTEIVNITRSAIYVKDLGTLHEIKQQMDELREDVAAYKRVIQLTIRLKEAENNISLS